MTRAALITRVVKPVLFVLAPVPLAYADKVIALMDRYDLYRLDA